MRKIRRMLISLLAAAISAAALPVFANQPAAPVFVSPSFYGREALSALNNGERLASAYDKITAGMGNTENIYEDPSSGTPNYKISTDIADEKLSKAELETVLDAYRRDHPEHFWYNAEHGSMFWILGDRIITVELYCYMSAADSADAKKKFDAAAEELLRGITPDMPEFDREKLLHDRLAKKITYDLNEAYMHSAYGALVNGRAVCDGYTESLQYLLGRVGIQAFTVLGMGTDISGNTEPHAWNIVRIDGKYYNVDLTWDDQGSNILYAYFNLTDARMTEDHAPEETKYAMPVCDSEEAGYFTVFGGKTEGFSAEELGGLIRNNGTRLHVYVTGDTAAFSNDLRNNFFKMTSAAGLGISAVSGKWYSLGREFLIIVIVRGDANGDGITDIRDYVSMKECALTAKYDEAADINADRSVNASDLTELRKRLLEAE